MIKGVTSAFQLIVAMTSATGTTPEAPEDMDYDTTIDSIVSDLNISNLSYKYITKFVNDIWKDDMMNESRTALDNMPSEVDPKYNISEKFTNNLFNFNVLRSYVSDNMISLIPKISRTNGNDKGNYDTPNTYDCYNRIFTITDMFRTSFYYSSIIDKIVGVDTDTGKRMNIPFNKMYTRVFGILDNVLASVEGDIKKVETINMIKVAFYRSRTEMIDGINRLLDSADGNLKLYKLLSINDLMSDVNYFSTNCQFSIIAMNRYIASDIFTDKGDREVLLAFGTLLSEIVQATNVCRDIVRVLTYNYECAEITNLLRRYNEHLKSVIYPLTMLMIPIDEVAGVIEELKKNFSKLQIANSRNIIPGAPFVTFDSMLSVGN